MLDLTIIEFFIRVIPESIIFVLSIYLLSNTKIDKKRCTVTIVIVSILVFLIRLLPIHYGVHTILNMIALIVLTVLINKIELIADIRATVITFILVFISEGINLFLIQSVFNKDITVLFNNPIEKLIYGIPSLLIVLSIILSYHKIKNRKRSLELSNSMN